MKVILQNVMSESGGGSKNECLKPEHTDQQRHLVHQRNITLKEIKEKTLIMCNTYNDMNCDHSSINILCGKAECC